MNNNPNPIQTDIKEESEDIKKIEHILKEKPELKYITAQLIEQLSGDRDNIIKEGKTFNIIKHNHLYNKLKILELDTAKTIKDILENLHEAHFNPSDIYDKKKRTLLKRMSLLTSEKYKNETLQTYGSLLLLHRDYINNKDEKNKYIYSLINSLKNLGYTYNYKYSDGQGNKYIKQHYDIKETIHQIEEYIFTIEQILKKRNILPTNKDDRMDRDKSIYNGIQYMDPNIVKDSKENLKAIFKKHGRYQ